MKKFSMLSLLVILFSCQQSSTVDTKAEGEKIIQLSKEWSQAAATGDVDKIVSYWADDAIQMSAGDQPVKGKEALRQMVQEGYKMPGFSISWQPQSVEVSESGDMAYLIEDSRMSFQDSTGNPVVINSKAVSIWRKQANGEWKNHVDISTPLARPGH